MFIVQHYIETIFNINNLTNLKHYHIYFLGLNINMLKI